MKYTVAFEDGLRPVLLLYEELAAGAEGIRVQVGLTFMVSVIPFAERHDGLLFMKETLDARVQPTFHEVEGTKRAYTKKELAHELALMKEYGVNCIRIENLAELVPAALCHAEAYAQQEIGLLGKMQVVYTEHFAARRQLKLDKPQQRN